MSAAQCAMVRYLTCLVCLRKPGASKRAHFVIIDTRVLKWLARPDPPRVILVTEFMQRHGVAGGDAYNYSNSAQEVLFYGYIPNEAIVFQTSWDTIAKVLIPLYPAYRGHESFTIYVQGFESSSYTEFVNAEENTVVSAFLAYCKSRGSDQELGFTSKPHDMQSVESLTAFITSALWPLFRTNSFKEIVLGKWPECPYAAAAGRGFLALHTAILDDRNALRILDVFKLLIGELTTVTMTGEADLMLGDDDTSNDDE